MTVYHVSMQIYLSFQLPFEMGASVSITLVKTVFIDVSEFEISQKAKHLV